MAKYKVELLRPGVTKGVSAVEREYSEKALREAMGSLEDTRVTVGSDRLDPDNTVGRVVDYEYDSGVIVTVEIIDEETIERLDAGLAEIAPSMVMESADGDEPVLAEDIEFRSLFLSPEVSELVGSTERV